MICDPCENVKTESFIPIPNIPISFPLFLHLRALMTLDDDRILLNIIARAGFHNPQGEAPFPSTATVVASKWNSSKMCHEMLLRAKCTHTAERKKKLSLARSCPVPHRRGSGTTLTYIPMTRRPHEARATHKSTIHGATISIRLVSFMTCISSPHELVGGTVEGHSRAEVNARDAVTPGK